MFYPLLLVCISACAGGPIWKDYKGRKPLWHLGMNLNPADNHTMGYVTGWGTGESIGSPEAALYEDYLNRLVWMEPANYIAIVRHQEGVVDAVKVFQFKYWGLSLLARFRETDPGRRIVSGGGPIQEKVAFWAENLEDDPIFSVGGELAFNWVYTNNGHRIVMTGGHLSAEDSDDDNTHGLGNNFKCEPLDMYWSDSHYAHEISNIQDCPNHQCKFVEVQGTDHGGGYSWDRKFKSGPVYGEYAIYVSDTAYSFPGPGTELGLVVSPDEKY